MRKAVIVVCIGVVVGLSGCASIWKAMGVATVSSVKDQDSRLSDLKTTVDGLTTKMDDSASQQNARLDQLKTAVDDLSSKADEIQKTTAQVEKIETLVSELQGKIDLLPQETLRKLADILSKAAAETKSVNN